MKTNQERLATTALDSTGDRSLTNGYFIENDLTNQKSFSNFLANHMFNRFLYNIFSNLDYKITRAYFAEAQKLYPEDRHDFILRGAKEAIDFFGERDPKHTKRNHEVLNPIRLDLVKDNHTIKDFMKKIDSELGSKITVDDFIYGSKEIISEKLDQLLDTSDKNKVIKQLVTDIYGLRGELSFLALYQEKLADKIEFYPSSNEEDANGIDLFLKVNFVNNDQQIELLDLDDSNGQELILPIDLKSSRQAAKYKSLQALNSNHATGFGLYTGTPVLENGPLILRDLDQADQTPEQLLEDVLNIIKINC